ncbi:hypothetical protein [Mariprofundus sp. KV]|uniref:hypothetical protein n=1 Tax=Mariprofundus sp. KV TaxID=2608715 RepID=UPI0015A2DCCF|nr:hypothetical protein [Mariprofundus sp. KV]NWF36665.1 hypothetical protein [Mariprofundus sp. KV]
MGRRSKPPVEIKAELNTEVTPTSEGLPVFQHFFDVLHTDARKQCILTRVFFMSPTPSEVEDTCKLKDSFDGEFHCVGGVLPGMCSALVSTPLCKYIVELGFSESFAKDVARLCMFSMIGKEWGRNRVANLISSLKEFMSCLASLIAIPTDCTLSSITYNHWSDFRELTGSDSRISAKNTFNTARYIFMSYPPTSLNDHLKTIRFKKTKQVNNPNYEHTSELFADNAYSDAEMYQLLAVFISGFQRRIGYLKHMHEIAEKDMPDNWIHPDRKHVFIKWAGRKRPKFYTDITELIAKWLGNEKFYDLIVGHYLLWHKIAGKDFVLAIRGVSSRNEDIRVNLVKFRQAMGERYGFCPESSLTLMDFHIKKRGRTDKKGVMHQLSYCLANLLMMQCGVNKEVALSIPSRDENGKSILKRLESLFVGKNDNPEVELFGFKNKTGKARAKKIPIPIPITSPLYSMLIDYEKYYKTDFDGPFFEVAPSFGRGWSVGGSAEGFLKNYPVMIESGEMLKSLDTTKFRKVFAAGKLYEHMENIQDANQLASQLREDLNHGNLSTSLNNYILKTSGGRGIIDVAIATITSEKLKEGIEFKGRIITEDKMPKTKKTVYLCECEDPEYPSHGESISNECTHYDLCLGCERSVICKEHLPYICARIIQYEENRNIDPVIWPALWEDRWMIAHDALDNYAKKNRKNGSRLVEEAWASAKSGKVTLPPIIMSEI